MRRMIGMSGSGVYSPMRHRMLTARAVAVIQGAGRRRQPGLHLSGARLPAGAGKKPPERDMPIAAVHPMGFRDSRARWSAT